MNRANRSDPPPAPHGQTTVIAWLGYGFSLRPQPTKQRPKIISHKDTKTQRTEGPLPLCAFVPLCEFFLICKIMAAPQSHPVSALAPNSPDALDTDISSPSLHRYPHPNPALRSHTCSRSCKSGTR